MAIRANIRCWDVARPLAISWRTLAIMAGKTVLDSQRQRVVKLRRLPSDGPMAGAAIIRRLEMCGGPAGCATAIMAVHAV